MPRTPQAEADALDHVFMHELVRLTGRDLGNLGSIGVAVSGGPDSMALTALTIKLANAQPDLRIAAATMDHKLRPESAAEAKMVAEFCASKQMDHQILTPANVITGNVQSAARTERYAALDQWAQQQKITWLLTAHHADDQLETMMMRLNRGSGVAGMSAIRERNGNILRPLLSLTKSQLQGYVEHYAIPFINDPSNDNIEFDRVSMRLALQDNDWLDPIAANHTAQALRDADDALQWSTDYFARYALSCENGNAELDPGDIPHEILRRLVLMAIQYVQPGYQPRGPALGRLISSLNTKKKSVLGDILCHSDDMDGKIIWHFTPAPPRRTS